MSPTIRDSTMSVQTYRVSNPCVKFTTSSASTWKGYDESESMSLTGDDATASGSLATGLRNPNMDAVALWYGMVNRVFAVMCNVIF